MGAAEDVRDTILKVVRVRQNAISDLDSGWTTAEEYHAIRGIMSMPIDAWIKEGQEAVKSGRIAESWLINYKARGELFARSVADLHDNPASERTANIEATAQGVSNDIRKIAVAVKDTTDKTVTAVAKTANALPWVIGGAAALYLIFTFSGSRKT